MTLTRLKGSYPVFMMAASQRDRAQRFHDLHDRDTVLCLLNAWDAGSARIFEAEGCPAIGTTSAVSPMPTAGPMGRWAATR